jgi:hypothetical protein
MKLFLQCLVLLGINIFASPIVNAHGIAGKRYFPPTIVVDDPYAANETHAVVGRTPNIGAGNVNTSSGNVGLVGLGIEPLDGFGIAIDGVYRQPNGNLTPQANGFDNLYYTIKKELEINDRHEFAVTVGISGQASRTGGKGSESYSTYAPTIYYAKGFGDLPNSMNLLKPFAITGLLGYQMPTEQSQAKVFNWGFTIQYSFLYLDQHVRPTGWNTFFNSLVAVVEFPMQTCLNTSCAGQVTGSINPGIIWVGEHFNLSAEAVFPVNRQSGTSNGVLFQIHKYLGKE